jgi:hypothetical protein
MGVSEVIRLKTQLNDALIAFGHHLDLFQGVIDELNRLTIRAVFFPSGQVGNFLLTAEEHNRTGADYKNHWSR